MKPICVKCQRFYRIKRTGMQFIEAMPAARNAKPGTQDSSNWTPYKLWSGDLWECQGCGHQTIAGVGFGPIAEHYQPNFEANLAAMELDGLIQINDC